MWTISTSDLIALAGLFTLWAGSLTAMWWHLSVRITAANDELAEYKLEVAEKYAKGGHLKEVEVRLTDSMDRLTERIDTLLERMSKTSPPHARS